MARTYRLMRLMDAMRRLPAPVTAARLAEETGVSLESENHETVGGFVMDLMGEVPDEETSIEREIPYKNCIFRILSVRDRRIEKVALTVLEKEPDSEDERVS